MPRSKYSSVGRHVLQPDRIVDAVPRTPHRRDDEVAGPKEGDVRAHRFDAAEALVTDDEKVEPFWRVTVFSRVDLAVGAVDTDLQDLHEHAAPSGNVCDVRFVEAARDARYPVALVRLLSLSSSFSTLLEQLRDERGPARLMAGSDASAVVAVEVLVEQNQIAPVRIVLERLDAAEHRTPAILVAQEDARHPARELRGHLAEGHELPGSGRALDGESVAVVVMELLQRLDQEIVDRKPDRPAPVGVAAEQARRRLGRLVADFVSRAVHVAADTDDPDESPRSRGCRRARGTRARPA